MGLFHRKSKMERLLGALESNDLVKSTARRAVETAVANATSPKQGERAAQALDSLDLTKAHKGSGPIKKTMKAGLAVTAGVVALTAASATVSSIRHHESTP